MGLGSCFRTIFVFHSGTFKVTFVNDARVQEGNHVM